MIRKSLGALILALNLLVAGCSSSSPSTPPPAATLSLSPSSAGVFSTQTVQLTVNDSNGASDVNWSVSGTSGGSVDANGVFTAPSVAQNTTITVTATSHSDPSKTASSTITVLASGTVAGTANPQVAQYTLTPPAGANVFIQFGKDATYNLKTWTQPTPASGALSFYVAGMLASTEYHMRAVVQFADGSTASDLDHTFTTQSLQPNQLPTVAVTTTPGTTPQPGVEMLDLIIFNASPLPFLAVVDLSGNLLWTYPAQSTGGNVYGVHLLPNGHFLICLVPGFLREIDLAGNTIQEENGPQMNASFAKAGLPYKIAGFSHDIIELPNGHWISLVQTVQPCSAIPNCSGLGNIRGDIIVDLGPNGDGTFSLAWYWSSFDHLNINRALQGYPDWTHSNALLYSPDDGNLLLSIRHQSWIIKIDYANGTGSGDILWRLGYQGDFTLVGGTDPTDWFYAQHGPAFTTSNTTGKFDLAVFDNGNLRVFAPGITCSTKGNPPCAYSRAIVLHIDEAAKTATLLDSYVHRYSFWGGNVSELGNSDLEANFTTSGPKGYTDLYELTPDSSHATVWHLQTGTQYLYRAFRMPSLYPGVQW